MKKLLLATIFFSFFWILSPVSTYAARQCKVAYANQCGALGGCNVGSSCNYDLQGISSCSPDGTCPTTSVVCGGNGTDNACGPSAGCRYGERCQLSTDGYFCNPASDICPAAPDTCPSNSAPECVVTMGDSIFPKNVGDSCDATGKTCQHQGAPYSDSKKCVCRVASNVTPSVVPTVRPSTTPTPIPTLPLIESTGQSCSSIGKNMIYPPNSLCYKEVETVPSDIEQYPLTCIPGVEVKYENTVVSDTKPEDTVTVSIRTDLSKVSLGFLGPDSKALSTMNPDQIAKKYLFNGLFDRPSYSIPNTPRELFRTFWRIYDSRIQANLKASYLQMTNTSSTKLDYYYLDSNLQEKTTDTETLFNELPVCLRNFPVCEDYIAKYKSLSEGVKSRYDSLLPFDFYNTRGYITLEGNISKESIPYLQAIVGALKSDYSPLNSYTPSWMIQPISSPPTVSSSVEGLLYQKILDLATTSSCAIPQKSTSALSPLTYPVENSITRDIVIPVTSVVTSSTDGVCTCSEQNPDCSSYSCGYYSDNSSECASNGCNFIPGETVYKVTGETKEKHATILNSPYINLLNKVIVGTGQPGDQSFYRMLTPSFAPVIDKIIISAPTTKTETADTNTTIKNNGSSPVYRENALAQNAMHLIQNCWFVPSSMQTSPICGILKNITTPITCDASCNKTFPGASATLALQAHYADLASRWVGAGTPATDKFSTVVNSAVAAGVNPIFALSSWLLESGASNYDGICEKLGGGDLTSGYCTHLLDFGINKDEIASNYSTGQFYFSEQLRQYLDIPGYYKDVCKEEMAQSSCPMRIFTAMFLDGNCEPSDASDKYYAAIKNIYNLIAPTEVFPCYPTTYP